MAIYAQGDVVRASVLRDRVFPTVGYAQADVTLNNSTTLTPMPGFSVYLEGATEYALDGYIAYSTNATADIAWVMFGHFAISTTASSTTLANQSHFTFGTVHLTSGANPGSLDGAHLVRIDGDFVFGGFGGAGTAGLVMAARPTGWVYTAREPGLLQMTFRQNTADASNTTIKAGSWIRFTKLAVTEP